MDHYERTTTRTDATDPAYVPAGGVTTTEREVAGPTPTAGDVLRRAIALAFGILQALLILRIILLLLIANRDNSIVQFVLSVTDPFVEPFRGMFQLDRVSAQNGSVLDVAALVALVGWTIVEALVLAVAGIFRRPYRTA
ncbi:MAG TPA: YggT family protein [Candidatus Limnocylindrales bacterium]|nr:YggT family protein [Candidatus Limnocylindrales bacterium]